MRSQQPGMSQSQPRQQSGSNDMQLLQQHLMYKQLQELQRQQQLQQLNQVARQQNSVIQLSTGAKPAAVGQLPALLNGMPISNMSSYMRQNEFMGNEPKISTSSQMFAGNLNWPQHSVPLATYEFPNGLMFSNEQGHALQSVGFVPQQPNQSFYGTPVLSSRAPLDQYPQLEGLSNASAMESGNRNFSQREHPVLIEQGAVHDIMAAKNGFQENNLFVNVSSQNQINNNTQEHLSQVNHQSQSIQVQEIQSRQDGSDLSGILQEKPGAASRGVSKLDPTEEKILFGTDNDANWAACLGRNNSDSLGGNLHGNPLADNDYFGAFPSVQSGSWSALMLDALDVSSSDTGVQEEWSGASLQKAEISHGNHSAFLNENEKQQTWNGRSMQNVTSLSSRPFPLFNESEASPSCHTTNCQPSHVRFSYEHSNRVSSVVSHDGSQQSSKEAKIGYLNQTHQQKQYVEGGFEHKIQLHGSTGAGARHMYDQMATTSCSTEQELKNPHNMKRVWPHQQNTHSSTVSARKDDINGTVLTETDHDGRIRMTVSGDNKLETTLQQAVPSEGCSHSPSVSCQLGDNGSFAKENLFFSGNSSHHFDIRSQITVSPSDQENSVSRRLHYHHMGDVAMNMEAADEPTQASYLQVPSQFQGLENLNQGHSGCSQNVSHFVSNNAMCMGKGQVTNYQANAQGSVETCFGTSTPCNDTKKPAYLDGAATQWSQNRSVGQTSQNMLELLKKVGQSRDSRGVTQFGFSDHRSQSEIPKLAASHPQHKQSSALQGFNLQLAPPSQRQSVANDSLPPQTSSHDLNGNQLDQEAVDNDRDWSNRMSSAQSPHSADATSQRDHSDSKSSISRRVDKETSHSRDRTNILSATSSSISNWLQQQQLQNTSIASRHGAMGQSIGGSFSADLQAEKASYSGPMCDSYSGTMNNKVVQASVSSVSGTTPSFRFPSYSDTRAPFSSHLPSLHTTQSQLMSASFSHTRNSSQHVPPSNMKSISQPSGPSLSKQDAYSAMLNNVWKNVSSQRLSGVQPHRFIPNILQSMIPSTNGGDVNSWAPMKADDQGNKRGSNVPGSATCPSNAQEVIHGDPVQENSSLLEPSDLVETPKAGSAHHGQSPATRHFSDGKSAVSISSLVRLHQQDLSRGKYTNDLNCDPQTHLPPQKDVCSTPDVAMHGQRPKPSDEVQQQNYSLLKQVQTMKAIDSDHSRRIGKQSTGADHGSDGMHMDPMAAHMFTFGQKKIFSVATDSELGMNSHSSSPSDVKMVSFNESQSASSQFLGKELSAQNISTSGRYDLHSHPLTKNSKSTPMVASEHPQISPQMAPSWFEQYGNYRNGQILTVLDKLNIAKLASQHLSLAKISDSMGNTAVLEQEKDISNGASLRESTSTTLANAIEVVPHYLGVDEVLKAKKRKHVKPEVLPWHKVVIQGPQKRQSIRMAEVDWARASNRLTEKVQDEVELAEEGPSIPQSHRRIILTTQLMQLLLPSLPTAILNAEAKSSYESLTYFSARAALSNACCSISPSGIGSGVNANDENATSEKHRTSEEDGQQIFLRLVEGTVGRSSNLENDFSRLVKRTSMLDLRIECQELERFSIINRLGKFHGRSQADGFESSLNPHSAPRKLFPQRYVTALPLTGYLPEGVLCFSI